MLVDLRRERARLWRLFRRAALVGAPVGSLALWACECPPPSEEIHLLRAPDAQTSALIDRCRTGVDGGCLSLCQHLAKNSETRGSIIHCELHPDRDGYVQVHVGYASHCPGGRRPAGYSPTAVSRARATAHAEVGTALAELAQLEAASVPAFQRLRDELVAFDAPAPLAAAAAEAAHEEVCHARAVEALAERWGARAGSPILGPNPTRNLEELAIENAVEGCVRETYGALLACSQARTAQDPAIRRALDTIARDETGHAALAQAVDRWSAPRLTTSGRRRVIEARRAAIAELRAAVRAEVPSVVREAAGLPDPTGAAKLLDRLEATAWA